MFKIIRKIRLFLIGADDFVDCLPVIRDKKRPYLCYVVTPFFHYILFGSYTTIAFYDKSHPSYLKMWKDRIEDWKDYELKNGKLVKRTA